MYGCEKHIHCYEIFAVWHVCAIGEVAARLLQLQVQACKGTAETWHAFDRTCCSGALQQHAPFLAGICERQFHVSAETLTTSFMLQSADHPIEIKHKLMSLADPRLTPGLEPSAGSTVSAPSSVALLSAAFAAQSLQSAWPLF